VAWFARRKLREAEEECCDAWVVWTLPSERKSYGEAMLATIEFLTDGPKLPALAGSTFGGSEYKRRIEMIMKRNVNRRLSWAALGMLVLVAMSVLPLVAQTTSSDNGNRSSQSDASAPRADSNTKEVESKTDVGVPADSAAAGTTGDQAVKTASSDADETPSAQNEKRPRTDAGGESDRQSTSMEAVLKRLSHLEQLLQERSDGRLAASTNLRSGSPDVSDSTISSDTQEQDLQLELLMLDVAAAKADIEPARLKWQKSTQANKKQPGTVSQVEIELQRAQFEQKLVQRQRAEALFALYKRQVERNRKEAAQQQGQRAPAAAATNRELDELNKALRAEELVRLKKLNEETVKEITRLERLLKEEPDSPETRQAVEDFWRAYRSLQGREANEDFWKVHRSLRGEANEGYWRVYPSLPGREANKGDAGGGAATNRKN